MRERERRKRREDKREDKRREESEKRREERRDREKLFIQQSTPVGTEDKEARSSRRLEAPKINIT